jgi:hypothetical protein
LVCCVVLVSVLCCVVLCCVGVLWCWCVWCCVFGAVCVWCCVAYERERSSIPLSSLRELYLIIFSNPFFFIGLAFRVDNKAIKRTKWAKLNKLSEGWQMQRQGMEETSLSLSLLLLSSLAFLTCCPHLLSSLSLPG